MTTQQVDINKWQEICQKGFNGDKTTNDFILFLEGCGKKDQESIHWTTTDAAFQAYLSELNIASHQSHIYTISNTDWAQLQDTKRQVRMAWHEERQMQLSEHLKTRLNAPSSSCPLSAQYQRMEGLHDYIKTSTDLGTVPFLRGLVGFLRYQLVHKDRLAEWHMSEYVLTQKEEDAMDRDVDVLQQVLGFQLIYKDDTVVIPIDQNEEVVEQVLIWRMNPDLTDHDINEMLKALPKDQNTQGYQLSDIERQQQALSLFRWLYQIVLNCFSHLF
ncbi:hypothetical protein K501DRAFT_287534 [Backusella circina FSU 941]|nr:hypothetical protein K501DRAFT_287534 [Backusella circina FSU 941]